MQTETNRYSRTAGTCSYSIHHYRPPEPITAADTATPAVKTATGALRILRRRKADPAGSTPTSEAEAQQACLKKLQQDYLATPQRAV
jgi:hypothetical protein